MSAVKVETGRHCSETFLSALGQVDLTVGNILIQGSLDQGIVVHDPAQPEGQQDRKGQFFASLPDRLAEVLPDSDMTPEEFLSELGLQADVVEKLSGLLLGGSEENGHPIMRLGEQGFTLRVGSGSTNERALVMTEIAAKGFDDDQLRGEYQSHEFALTEFALKLDSDADVRIVEDCVASGDTIAGVMALFAQSGRINEEARIRVDVTSATAQGILVLREFAKQNGFQLELNVGFLAWGLSAGEAVGGDGAKLHANYITYPQWMLSRVSQQAQERLVSSRAGDGNIYVIGDMGNAAKSLPQKYDEQYPWNLWRDDQHGPRKAKTYNPEEYRSSGPINLFFANGGYLSKAMLMYGGDPGGASDMTIVAKRIWSDQKEFGYGVWVDGIRPGLFDRV